MKRFILSATFLLLILPLVAQTAMGKWRSHLAYNSVVQIAQSRSKIFAVSEGALYSVSKADGDIEFYSKMSGLNDANIFKIDYDSVNDQLLIIYTNGNIDIMHNAGVNNIPDLFNKQMNSSKNINHVFFRGPLAYLSTDFGIMLLNMTKKEIADTYFIGQNSSEIKVNATTIHDGIIFAATNNALYQADASNPNLVNFEFWSSSTDYPGQGNFENVFSFAGHLMLLRGGKLYRHESGKTWTLLAPSLSITSSNVSNGRIVLGNNTDNLYIIDENFDLREQKVMSSPDVEYDPANDTYWLAAGEFGVVSFRIQNGSDPIVNYFKPFGPAVNIPWDLTFAGEKLFMVNGGRWAAFYGRTGQIMIYENGVWTNINGADIAAIISQQVPFQRASDFMNVAVHPDDNSHFFVTSFGSGVFEFRDNKFFKWYNHTNSTLSNIIGGTPYYYLLTDGAIFDKDKNLFLVNMFDANAVKILLNNGEWKRLYFPKSSNPTLGKIIINKLNTNQKWVPSLRYSPGIFIWDDNGTLTDQSDDRNVFLSRFPDADNQGSFITPNNIFTLAQDKNGVIWAGTDIGPLLFYNTSRVYDEDYTCTRVKIPRNDGTGLADYLLQNEKIKAIAIDGANRKWLGTESSGLYLMSENGQETIYHFTTSNSPLLSNDIISLAINPVSGEVFVGTSNGLVSFQSDAAEASGAFGDVYAYPNPVRENYNGIITITGLVARTNVKITDLNGNLIYQTVSNGSIATWDGKDVHGRKVNTGIYMAICANEDGTQSAITKIMVIN